MLDRRSPEARTYRNLYKTKGWQRRRQRQLMDEPLCQRCKPRGQLTPATEVHHLIPHKGNPELFFRGELQSLCKPCHDSDAQSEEVRGYSTEIGADGWPVDERHPANRG